MPKCFQSKYDEQSLSPEGLWLSWNLDSNSSTVKTKFFCVETREMHRTMQKRFVSVQSLFSNCWVAFLLMGYHSRVDYHNLFEKIGMELTQTLGNAP